MLKWLGWLCAYVCVIWSVESATILDPALYLSPSPPMSPASDTISPGDLWSLSQRRTRDTEDLTTHPVIKSKQQTTTAAEESMEKAETFWPRPRTTSYGLRGIHVPMTFSISGNYGNNGYGNFGATGIIGSSYASVSNDDSDIYSTYGKSALAGSSYGIFSSGYPGIRIFGNSGKSSWSGWGNGKWGHYGKG
ncbi:uncharacterized protein LOC113521826 isoform X2 [Galleria mellonella]|uniref:Uncharacterized protein LOC113521826 isoform X2 n=1 Tax=Galleria mellonella TaxID=7137 RepID=A0A6J1X867_GALME|nr:uncharacterized protein LOC113521826 isoform X2 [Galleria mellonella]